MVGSLALVVEPRFHDAVISNDSPHKRRPPIPLLATYHPLKKGLFEQSLRHGFVEDARAVAKRLCPSAEARFPDAEITRIQFVIGIATIPHFFRQLFEAAGRCLIGIRQLPVSIVFPRFSASHDRVHVPAGHPGTNLIESSPSALLLPSQ